MPDYDDEFEGIDRKQLAKIKQRFLALNATRLERTLAVLSERQQQFLQLLPLLFHVNHPMLPGYVSHKTPAGIHGYTPAKEDMRLAKVVARSFNYQRDLADKSPHIDALFYMGSLGTIAQADNSDIDVWVCHNDGLSAQALAELQGKCNGLSRWAADVIHIETHFFLMSAQKFRAGQQSNLTSEASGSAQHFLLLDEFYRTAVWLAGKLPLWWFVPAEDEQDYDNYAANLLGKRFLRAADFLDFGGVPAFPLNEFVGAGIWQLYKGIDSPHKSVLKLMLLEAYANAKFSEPLSLTMKRKIYALTNNLGSHRDNWADDLDAYVLVYLRLQDYLRAQSQPARLELVRRCFYFKADRRLSRNSRNATKSWQRLLLENLVREWGWDQLHLTILDNRAWWKSPHVLAERNLLANELSQSYRLLVDMSKSARDEAAISNAELLILGRKLHAAFERKAGKIDWINPGISQDLSEPALCFVHTHEDGIPVWQMYRGSQQDFALRNQATEPVRRSRHFIELLFWCYGNGIYAAGTRLDIVSEAFFLNSSQRQQLWQLLQQWLPIPPAKTPHENFIKNAQPAQMLLLINIGVEPQAELHKKGMQMLSNQRDALGYSGLKENLVLTVDLVQRNSWGEIVCRHFSGDALVGSLLHYLRSLPPDKKIAPPQLSIRCFSLGQGSLIEQRVLELWRAVIACFYSGTRARNPRFIFEMAEEYFLLQIVQQHAQVLKFKSYEKLLEKLAQPPLEFSPLVIDSYALRDKPLRLFCEQIKKPGIYLFYQLEQQVQLTVVDHTGAFFSKSCPLFNVQTLLRPLCRFIRAATERQLLDQEQGQDSHALDALQSIHIFELLGDVRQKNAWLEARTVAADISQLQFINVCAVAEPGAQPGAQEQLSFTLYCDGREFSALEFGDELFAAVARYIIERRQGGETYPCYITDLDLSLCRDLIAPQTGVQLIHYLHIKNEVEQRLNEALAKC
jgi:adenylate cyclase, class 1